MILGREGGERGERDWRGVGSEEDGWGEGRKRNKEDRGIGLDRGGNKEGEAERR